MLNVLPLMIVPLIAFNMPLVGALGQAAEPGKGFWSETLLTLPMLSGGQFALSFGEGLLALGLLFLFIEVIKATRTSRVSMIDHALSTLVLIAYVVEFLLVPAAAHPVFFLLAIMALIDVIAGFSVSIRSAGRDISLN